MWCAECQLDAPALAVPEEPGVIRCAYCRSELSSRTEQTAAEAPPASLSVAAIPLTAPSLEPSLPPEPAEAAPLRLCVEPPPAFDDWEADIELRHVERLVGVLRQAYQHHAGEPSAVWPSAIEAHSSSGAIGTAPAVKTPAGETIGLAAWACLSLGIMAFVCGGVLLIWSFAADRGDLWSLGLPLTLAGQVGLVLGLLLQLDGLSQSSRRTEQTLSELDGQLHELRDVTALVSSTHSGPAHAFYSHLTQGASPPVLLADLKGQLDLLAQQMARQRRAA